jgi:hypothetical protein
MRPPGSDVVAAAAWWSRFPLLTYIIRFQFMDFFFANPYPSYVTPTTLHRERGAHASGRVCACVLCLRASPPLLLFLSECALRAEPWRVGADSCMCSL